MWGEGSSCEIGVSLVELGLELPPLALLEKVLLGVLVLLIDGNVEDIDLIVYFVVDILLLLFEALLMEAALRRLL